MISYTIFSSLPETAEQVYDPDAGRWETAWIALGDAHVMRLSQGTSARMLPTTIEDYIRNTASEPALPHPEWPTDG